MKHFLQAALSVVVAATVAGCASPQGPDATDGQQLASECVKTIGTNICRRPGAGDISPVKSISGDELRRQGGSITMPRTSRIGD